MTPMKNLTWQQVTIVVAFLGAIVALTWTGRDTAALIAVGTAVMAGLGLSLGQTQQVKEQTNGTMTRLLEMVENHTKLLATMTPPPAAVPPIVDDEAPQGT